MKTHITKILTLVAFMSAAAYAQDTEEPRTVDPVKHTFENAVLINNQTVEAPDKKTLDFIIQHRFGVIEEPDDLFGIYAPANIRLGLNYGITKNLSIGIGATKNKRYYDLEWKYILLRQMPDKGSPVTIAYYGDLARSADDKEKFINQENTYNASNRITYFHELMIARKFTPRLSLQVGGTYSYFNIVDSVLNDHGFIGASIIGRYQFSPQSSVQVEFDYPLTVSTDIPDEMQTKPNLGIGYEVATSGHQFQIFLCTATGILNQETRVYNPIDFTEGDFILGFNITRQWGF